MKNVGSSPTNVLISETNEMYCDLLRRAFSSVRSRFQVVAFASSAPEIYAALRDNPTQVAVVSSDLQDGPLSGIRILPAIRKIRPETRILVLMGPPSREVVTDAFRAGAVGVFNRSSPFPLLCKAIEVVARGQVWANTEELHYVLGAFAASIKHPKLDPGIETRITKREAAVVRLAVEGLSNREIARQLTLTEHTVKNYLFRVFDKLGVSNRVELVLSCLRQEQDERERWAADLATPSPPSPAMTALRKIATTP